MEGPLLTGGRISNRYLQLLDLRTTLSSAVNNKNEIMNVLLLIHYPSCVLADT